MWPILSSGAHPTLMVKFSPIIVSNLYWSWTGKWDNIRFIVLLITSSFTVIQSLPNKFSCTSTIVWLRFFSFCDFTWRRVTQLQDRDLEVYDIHFLWGMLNRFSRRSRELNLTSSYHPRFLQCPEYPHRAATAACPKWHTLIGLGTQLQRVGCSVWCSIIYLFE